MLELIQDPELLELVLECAICGAMMLVTISVEKKIKELKKPCEACRVLGRVVS